MSENRINDAQSRFFQHALLTWFDHYGRKNLPWQQQPTVYGIWVSEIMLQQTQVETVIPYYQKFIQHFPNIQALATASIDDVLTLWAGLGYYARARNLHKTAQIICQQYDGKFPTQHQQVVALPGIGRSTASAILAFAFNQHHSILDGNVKRVITRFLTLSGAREKKQMENQLWQIADTLTPSHRVADYTQAIMDLGATVCTRSKPECSLCPVKEKCQACLQNRQDEFPTPKTKTTRPLRQTRMLLIRDCQRRIFLQKRPPSGIWGGLWSLPQIDDESIDIIEWCRSSLAMQVQPTDNMSLWRHGFTHFELEISLLDYQLLADDHADAVDNIIREPADTLWLNPNDNQQVALPAIVKKICQELC